MKEKSISVIIPVYNGAATIRKCIESVIMQTYVHLIGEIIIINDGSTDETLAIAKLYTENEMVPVIVIDQNNQGVSKSRNTGAKLAKGEWLGFLDSDDCWIEDKIEKQSYVIDSCNEVISLGGNTSDKKQIIGWNKIDYCKKVVAKDMIIRSFPQTSTVLIHKKEFIELKGFDERQSYCEDMNLFVKIAYYYNYYHLNEKLVVYGDGKPRIGAVNGLSSNMKKMNSGAVKNIKDFYRIGIIGIPEYFFFRFFNKLKYMRRMVMKYVITSG